MGKIITVFGYKWSAAKIIRLMHKGPFQAQDRQDEQIEKYECQFATQGFLKVKGLYYHESSPATPTALSMRVGRTGNSGTSTPSKHIYKPISTTRYILNCLKTTAVSLSRKVIYGMVQSVLCCFRKLDDSVNDEGFE